MTGLFITCLCEIKHHAWTLNQPAIKNNRFSTGVTFCNKFNSSQPLVTLNNGRSQHWEMSSITPLIELMESWREKLSYVVHTARRWNVRVERARELEKIFRRCLTLVLVLISIRRKTHDNVDMKLCSCKFADLERAEGALKHTRRQAHGIT